MRHRVCESCNGMATSRDEALAPFFCAECRRVLAARRGGKNLLSCLECDDGKVLTKKEPLCKPCRIRREAPEPRELRRDDCYDWHVRSASDQDLFYPTTVREMTEAERLRCGMFILSQDEDPW